MGLNWPRTGANYVPAYQMSGIPFVTSSVADEVPGVESDAAHTPEPIKVTFPSVTKFITIRNTDATNDLRVGFSVRGMFDPGERMPESLMGGAATATKPLIASEDNRNYFILPAAAAGKVDTITLEVRCKEIYFLSNTSHASPAASGQSAGFSIVAGLTNIQRTDFPTLTGSAEFGGIG
jgi:hypothetical protein